MSRKLMNELLHEINSIEPQTSSQLAMLPLLTTETLTAMDAARIRLQKSESGIPDLEWFALLMGGFFTIFFTYFFVTNPLLQTINVSHGQLHHRYQPDFGSCLWRTLLRVQGQ